MESRGAAAGAGDAARFGQPVAAAGHAGKRGNRVELPPGTLAAGRARGVCPVSSPGAARTRWTGVAGRAGRSARRPQPAEKPQHVVDLAYPYFIARFPVTVAQWREYAERSGRPVDDDRRLHGRPNDPVVSINWHEARCFCDFLTQAWRGVLPNGFVVTLSSEAEWEKAARGGERIPVEHEWVTLPRLQAKLETAAIHRPNPFPTRAYPWGESFDAGRANAEPIIGETSAVGCYSTGASPYGCEDLSGNVWEWTRSLWSQDWKEPEFGYPYGPDDANRENLAAGDDVWRVLRGGSWDLRRAFARCASRFWFRPHIRYDFGFRVVLRSAPVS
ncbi:MAG: formylglycine-generating enzyme family protein [Candidatus Competibacteraceae bacterium]|nr:MAG: formylglycine-generating enzyme family protein [Candidatus Competibacteraceae bacterium]